MAVTDTGSTRLGCGRDLDDVWIRIEQPPDAHEQTCPDCQAARRDLAPLVAATSQLRTADLADTDLRPRAQMMDAIMSVARAEVRRGRQLPLRTDVGEDVDRLTISEQTVAQVVRSTADAMEGLEARRVGVAIDPSPALDRASRVVITMTVSVSYRLAIPSAMHTLRTVIIAAVAEATGLVVTSVDITVEDLLDV